MSQRDATSVPPFVSEYTREISDREFALFQALIYQEAGIWLAAFKKPLLIARLTKRLKILGLNSFGAYHQYVLDNTDPEERVRMLDAICTNETQFFREPQQFEFLERTVFPVWEQQAESGRRIKRIRVFSAACSTGEEPYTLAMMLLDRFPPHLGWSIDIQAGRIPPVFGAFPRRPLVRAPAGRADRSRPHE